MAFAKVSQKPRRSAFKKVASLLCIGKPRVHPGAYPAKPTDEPAKDRPQAQRPQAGVRNISRKEQKDVVADARTRTTFVVGTPVSMLQPCQRHLEEELRMERRVTADLKGKLLRLHTELNHNKAHCADLQTKVAELESKVVVGRTVAAAVQRAALRAELEEEMGMADMVPGTMHRAALQQAEEMQGELLESVQILDLQLVIRTDELAEVRRDLEQQKVDNAILYQACLQSLPTVFEVDCPLVGHLGSGGHGTVDLHTMAVAVKKARTEAEQRQLEAEHVIMNSLSHPRIPRAIASWQPMDGSSKGLITRYILGDSLFKQCRRCDPRGVPHRFECLSILVQLLDVLKYAHGLGRVHADIKTTNLMYHFDQLTVINWGVSYLITESATVWRGSVGTLRALAAVQPWRRGPEDDVRGFWAVAFELLTGRSVFGILDQQYIHFNSQPYFHEGLTQLCVEANLDPEDGNNRLLCAEFHQYLRVEEVEFLGLAADEDVPRQLLEMLMHGLSPAVSRGDAPTSSLDQIEGVLAASIQELEAKMRPQPVPDTAYKSEPEPVAAGPPRQSTARRRLDFGSTEPQPQAPAAACAHMPPAHDLADIGRWRNPVAAAAAARAAVAPDPLSIGGQVDDADAVAAACAQMLAEEVLEEVTERQEPQPAAAAPRQRLGFVMEFCEEVEPQPSAASLADRLPAIMESPERELGTAAITPCADMLPDSLWSPERELATAAGGSLADMLPGSLGCTERKTLRAAPGSLVDMLPDTLWSPKQDVLETAAASSAPMQPDMLECQGRGAAAASSLADMLPDTLYSPEPEMPHLSAALDIDYRAELQPHLLDTVYEEIDTLLKEHVVDLGFLE